MRTLSAPKVCRAANHTIKRLSTTEKQCRIVMETKPSPYPLSQTGEGRKCNIMINPNGLNDWNYLNVFNSQSLINFVTERVEPPSGVLCPQTWMYCDCDPSPPATITRISSGVSVTGIALSRVSFKSGLRFTLWWNVSSGKSFIR